MNNICVIIPVFNFPEMTTECLESVITNAGMKVDILIVDDGSSIPYMDLRVFNLALGKNTGFTNAINQGILWCGDKYKYVHLLNNDTIARPGFIKVLYDLMEKDNTIGIASSVRLTIVNGVKIIQGYGIDLICGYHSITEGWANNGQAIAYCDWLPLCSTLVRMEMIRYIGLLDRRFRDHCSDNDFCIRANQDGWKVVSVPESKVEHIGRVTTTHNKIETKADQELFIRKLAGIQTQELMNRLPLDSEAGTWGSMQFGTYNKKVNL